MSSQLSILSTLQGGSELGCSSSNKSSPMGGTEGGTAPEGFLVSGSVSQSGIMMGKMMR